MIGEIRLEWVRNSTFACDMNSSYTQEFLREWKYISGEVICNTESEEKELRIKKHIGLYQRSKIFFLEALALSICEQWDKINKTSDFVELSSKIKSRLPEENSHYPLRLCTRIAYSLMEDGAIDTYCRLTSFGRDLLPKAKELYPRLFE